MSINMIANLSSSVKRSGPSIQIKSIQAPHTLVCSVALLRLHHLPNLDEAICQVRDLATGEIRQALASKLLAVSYGKGAYLLEFMSEMGGNGHV